MKRQTGNFLGTEEKCQVIALTRRLFFVFKILTFAVGGKATSYSQRLAGDKASLVQVVSCVSHQAGISLGDCVTMYKTNMLEENNKTSIGKFLWPALQICSFKQNLHG